MGLRWYGRSLFWGLYPNNNNNNNNNKVWHYDRWDPNLFKGYVNTFVGLKQQASGWPQGCESQSDREHYINEFERVEGIRMDPDLVQVNPGLRMIAVY